MTGGSAPETNRFFFGRSENSVQCVSNKRCAWTGDQFDDMVKFLQRYAIIKACGTIEYVVKTMIADHVDAGASSELQNYISVKVRESSTNPTTGNISSLLGEFSSTGWKKSFDNALSHNEEKRWSLF